MVVSDEPWILDHLARPHIVIGCHAMQMFRRSHKLRSVFSAWHRLFRQAHVFRLAVMSVMHLKERRALNTWLGFVAYKRYLRDQSTACEAVAARRYGLCIACLQHASSQLDHCTEHMWTALCSSMFARPHPYSCFIPCSCARRAFAIWRGRLARVYALDLVSIAGHKMQLSRVFAMW